MSSATCACITSGGCSYGGLPLIPANTHPSHHHALLPAAASSWIRRSLADSLRSRRPYSVNLLLAGFDTTDDTSHLYWIDYLGTKATVPYAAHGFGQLVALSTMDKYWVEGADKRAGVDTVRKCIDEVAKREYDEGWVPARGEISAVRQSSQRAVGSQLC